jgi:hypothetical protein
LRYRMEFKDYFTIRNWLDWFYTWLVF